MKRSKNYLEAAKLVDKTKEYGIDEALQLIEKLPKKNLMKL